MSIFTNMCLAKQKTKKIQKFQNLESLYLCEETANVPILSGFIRFGMIWEGTPIISTMPQTPKLKLHPVFPSERIPSFQWQTRVFSPNQHSWECCFSSHSSELDLKGRLESQLTDHRYDLVFYTRQVTLRELGIHLFSDI